MDGIVLGVIGIAYSDYMLMSFRMINAIIKAHQDNETGKYRTSWEQTRMLAFYAANPETAKKAGKPDGLIKFPWEASKIKPRSVEDIRYKFEELDKKIKQLHG